MTAAEPDAWRHIASIACPRIREGTPGTAYVALGRAPDAGFGSAVFSCELKFNSREFDAAAGEPVGEATPDAYPIDDVEVGPADFVAPVPVADFRAAWEGLGPAGEVLETFQLPIKSVADAVASVVAMLGMVRRRMGGRDVARLSLLPLSPLRHPPPPPRADPLRGHGLRQAGLAQAQRVPLGALPRGRRRPRPHAGHGGRGRRGGLHAQDRHPRGRRRRLRAPHQCHRLRRAGEAWCTCTASPTVSESRD